MCRVLFGLSILGAIALATPAAADFRDGFRETEVDAPVAPDILPLRERARIEDAWLTERLDDVIPMIMRRAGIDMWVLIAREYNEDPVVKTMLPATWISARRRTVLVFHDAKGEGPVERLAVSRYPVGTFFPAAWNPEEEPDQWRRLAEIIAARDPKTIAVNVSEAFALADGTSWSQLEALNDALPKGLRKRIRHDEELAVSWLETRIPAEMEMYPTLVRTAHALIAEAFSAQGIQPGETTTQDVVWSLRQRVSDLGLDVWFHPSVTIQRNTGGGAPGKESDVQANARLADEVIRPGDFLHVDFGITYLGLNTDTQHHAYVLRAGERAAPAGLTHGLAQANRVQDILTAAFKAGEPANAILCAARAEAVAEGLRPSIYSHGIGDHGHGAGSGIGWWDDQSCDHPKGYRPVRADTAWSIELNATAAVPEWGGQDVVFKTEEDAYFDGETVRYIDGRQTEITLIAAE